MYDNVLRMNPDKLQALSFFNARHSLASPLTFTLSDLGNDMTLKYWSGCSPRHGLRVVQVIAEMQNGKAKPFLEQNLSRTFCRSISGRASPVDALRRSKAGLHELTRSKRAAITLSIQISLLCGYTSVPEDSLPCVKNSQEYKQREKAPVAKSNCMLVRVRHPVQHRTSVSKKSKIVLHIRLAVHHLTQAIVDAFIHEDW